MIKKVNHTHTHKGLPTNQRRKGAKMSDNSKTTTSTVSISLQDLTKAFVEMLHDEANGLTRFNEIEAALLTSTKGTPEHAALRKERTQMILQVRNSRKAQEAIKTEMLKI